MESDLTQSATFYKLWAWAEKNKKQLLWGVVAFIVVGLGVAFWLAHQSEKQTDANEALAKLTSREGGPSTPEATPEAFLKLADEYAGTDAGQRALLLGAGNLFAAGKYDEALAQFKKFLNDYNDSALAAQAALGVGACYDAQSKTNDAITAYQGVAEHYPNQNVVPTAKLALARLFDAQGKFKDEHTELEDIIHTFPGQMSSEAAMRLQQLNGTHPELQPTNRPAASTVLPVLNSTNH